MFSFWAAVCPVSNEVKETVGIWGQLALSATPPSPNKTCQLCFHSILNFHNAHYTITVIVHTYLQNIYFTHKYEGRTQTLYLLPHTQ